MVKPFDHDKDFVDIFSPLFVDKATGAWIDTQSSVVWSCNG